METATTWEQLYRQQRDRLAEAGVSQADFEAKQLVIGVSGIEPTDWSAQSKLDATKNKVARLSEWVERRISGEPLQYILGNWAFRGLDLFVDNRVLIPRPETEVVAGVAIDWLLSSYQRQDVPMVADLGCGSGAIGLSIASEVQNARVWLCDKSSRALEVARANLAGLGIIAGERVTITQGDWFDGLDVAHRKMFDVVVSNPPYVAELEDLDDEVAKYEPLEALIADHGGFGDLNRIATGALEWLRPGGVLVLECGDNQAGQLAELLSKSYNRLEVFRDLAGNPRGILAHNDV